MSPTVIFTIDDPSTSNLEGQATLLFLCTRELDTKGIKTRIGIPNGHKIPYHPAHKPALYKGRPIGLYFYPGVGPLSERLFISLGGCKRYFRKKILYKSSNNFFSLNKIFDYTSCFFQICVRTFITGPFTLNKTNNRRRPNFFVRIMA